MKKKNSDLKKKLVLDKETIGNLTPVQQAKLAGGYNTSPLQGYPVRAIETTQTGVNSTEACQTVETVH